MSNNDTILNMIALVRDMADTFDRIDANVNSKRIDQKSYVPPIRVAGTGPVVAIAAMAANFN